MKRASANLLRACMLGPLAAALAVLSVPAQAADVPAGTAETDPVPQLVDGLSRSVQLGLPSLTEFGRPSIGASVPPPAASRRDVETPAVGGPALPEIPALADTVALPEAVTLSELPVLKQPGKPAAAPARRETEIPGVPSTGTLGELLPLSALPALPQAGQLSQAVPLSKLPALPGSGLRPGARTLPESGARPETMTLTELPMLPETGALSEAVSLPGLPALPGSGLRPEARTLPGTEAVTLPGLPALPGAGVQQPEVASLPEVTDLSKLPALPQVAAQPEAPARSDARSLPKPPPVPGPPGLQNATKVPGDVAGGVNGQVASGLNKVLSGLPGPTAAFNKNRPTED